MSERAENAAPLSPPSILLGGLHLAGLWALAIVQPLLNLLGKNPDFFVARDNTSAQIIVFAILLAALPPLAAILVEALANLIRPLLRWVIHLALCAVLLSVFSLQLLKTFASGPAWPMIVFAVLLGGLLTWAYARARFVRSMADILGLAPVVILVSFFFFSDASKLITSDSDVEAREVKAANPAPVVMVVFDEFPAGSLMTPSGGINQRRFPNFAGLQQTSTWYRNTASGASYTAIAVPSILTGTPANRDLLPTAADHPDSIFTLLGKDWETSAMEPITQLCGSICGEEESADNSMGEALGSFYSDLKAVSAHLILPSDMGRSLPDISQSFQGFGETGDDEKERGRARQWVRNRLDSGERTLDPEGDVNRFITGLQPSGQTFDFIHVEKPHYPWTHYPSGLRYSDGTEDFRSFIGETETDWLAGPYLTDRAHQAHQLEIGFTDDLIGRIIDKLKKQGRWDETLFVATSDHGAAWTRNADRRESETETMGQVAMVPLFIKAPGQREGEIIDRPTCSTRIVPEMARILGIELPWEAGQCDPETIRMDNGTGPEVELSFAETIRQRQVYIDRMAKLLGGDGTGWNRAFRWGQGSELIGQDVRALKMEPPGSGYEVRPETPSPENQEFDPGVKLNPVLRQRGTISGLEPGVPLALAVNGRIAAVGQSYAERDETMYSILIPQSALVRGSNEITLYRMSADPGTGAGTAVISELWSSLDQ